MMKIQSILKIGFVLLLLSLVFSGCNRDNRYDSCAHEYMSEIIKSPTCTECGEAEYTCIFCGNTYITSVPTTEHSYNAWWTVDQEPNCTYEGIKSYHCSMCDARTEVTVMEKQRVHNVVEGACEYCGVEDSTPGLHFFEQNDGTYQLTGIGTCTENDIVVGIYNNRDVTLIAPSAFAGNCDILSVDIQAQIDIIYDGSFEWCENLVSLRLNEGLMQIGSNAFRGCLSLESIHIPSSVTRISNNNAFSICTSLKSITVGKENSVYCAVDGNLYSKDGEILVKYALGKSDNIFTVPPGVKRIEDCAFMYARNLVTLVVSDGVIEVGGGVSYCENLTEIILPNTLRFFGGQLLECDNVVYSEHHGGLYLGNSENPYLVLVDRTPGAAVTAVHPNAKILGSGFGFFEEDNISGEAIPYGVLTVSCYFSNCDWLTELVIPDSVTQISSPGRMGLVRDCDNLTEIVIPESVALITGYISVGCDNLSVIYCVAEEQPSAWDLNWNNDAVPVEWGCAGKQNNSR